MLTYASGGGGGSGGSGDVTGPASSTDNAIARFDGAGGKTLQNSVVTVADTTGDLAFPSDATIQTGAGNTSLTLRTEGTGGVAFANSTNLQATMDPSGSLIQAGANGYKVIGVVGADGTLPAFIPDKSDPNTGFSHGPSADQASVTAGGVEVVRANTVASGINHLEVTPGASGNPVLVESTIVAGTGGITVRAAAPAAAAGASVAGKPVAVTASAAVASTDTAGAAAGGNVSITGGAAARNTSGNANGGAVILTGGAGIGTGVQGQVQIPATPGSLAATPTLAFGDLDTGIWEASDDDLRFSTGGVERLRITSAGQILNAGQTWTLNTGGFITGRVLVNAQSSTPKTLDVLSNTGNLWTNEGATAIIVFNLPTAAANLVYEFFVQDADGIQVVAAAGDTIRVAASVTSAAGNISATTIGNSVRLVAINATEWVATSVVGTWTVSA